MRDVKEIKKDLEQLETDLFNIRLKAYDIITEVRHAIKKAKRKE